MTQRFCQRVGEQASGAAAVNGDGLVGERVELGVAEIAGGRLDGGSEYRYALAA